MTDNLNEPFQIPRQWQTPASFRDRLGDQVGRQRVMEDEDHILLILHAPPGHGHRRRSGRLFWRAPDGTWTSDMPAAGIAALEAHVVEFEKGVAALAGREESATTAAAYRIIMEELTPLLRTARNLHRVLQEARELAADDRGLLNIRDRAYQLERGAELLLEECRMSVECLAARRNEELAESGHRMSVSAHRLNILAAFFLPLATLSGVFGTNLRHGIEELQPPYPFLILAALGLGIGLFLAAIIGWAGGRKGEPE